MNQQKRLSTKSKTDPPDAELEETVENHHDPGLNESTETVANEMELDESTATIAYDDESEMPDTEQTRHHQMRTRNRQNKRWSRWWNQILNRMMIIRG